METNQLQEVIENGFRELRTELNEKFEKIDVRFETIDVRFEKIDGRFEKIDEKFEKIDGRFEKIDKDLAALGSDLKKVGDDARLAHVHIENLRHDLSIFDEGDATPLGKRVSALEVRVGKLERKPQAKR